MSEQTNILKWIPVTDHLPEKSGYYAATLKCNRLPTEVSNHIYFDKDSGKWGLYSDDLFSDRIRVIAWMPQLTPYREE